MAFYRKLTSILVGGLFGLSLAAAAAGQERDEYGDIIQSDYQAGDIVQTVARISNLQGTASYSRGDDPDNWQPADLNVPMTLGDRVYTSNRSRMELQVHGGDVIYLGARTDLAALNLTDDTKQFAVKSGIASFYVRRLDENDAWEVDTPNGAITFEQPGEYRVDVDSDGNTRFAVVRGAASVAAGGGQVTLAAGDAMRIEGIDAPRYSVTSISGSDRWDTWVRTRRDRLRGSPSYQYVNPDIVGADDLDSYGRWGTIPNYGQVWSPSSVGSDWAPYRAGRWGWQDPWGWTWISTEPWGWAPYHYGRWVTYASRWYWVPVAPGIRTVSYAPALVAFVGGPGFSASISLGGGGVVGWFPLGPREPFNPWWSARPATQVNVINVTNVTYVNRTYVTVVNQNTFINGGAVARNIVTDRAVVRQVAAAPVVRGVLAVVPTLASTRATGTTALRPPAAVVSRAVVARVAPPPAPPSFQQKLAVIRENRGAPVNPAAATRLVQAEKQQPRAVIPVRPVAAEQGRVTLAPSGSTAGRPVAQQRAVQPIAPARGRALATREQPVATGPVTGPQRGAQTQRPGLVFTPAQPGERETRPVPAPMREQAPEPAPTAPSVQRERMVEPTVRAIAPVPEREPQGRAVPTAPRDSFERPTPAAPERREQPVMQERQQQAPTPNWRDRQPASRQMPTARDVPQERVQAPPARERLQPTRSRVVEPRAQRVYPTAPPSRERVQPSRESAAPPERPTAPARAVERPDARPRSVPRPTPTPGDDRRS